MPRLSLQPCMDESRQVGTSIALFPGMGANSDPDSRHEKDQTTSPDTEPRLCGRVLAGRYRLLEEIAQGGYGRVFRAETCGDGDDVAVKILRPEFAGHSDVVERFRREAHLGVQVRHRNTISVLDSGRTSDGLMYIAMELLRGRPLEQVIDEEHPLPLPWLLDVTAQVLTALRVLHQSNIVHADLNSANVFVAETPDDLEVKLLDFGMAQTLGTDRDDDSDRGRVVTENVIRGTPGYVAPEVILGCEPTPLSDIYAAGVLLYKLLVGTLPFAARRPIRILHEQLRVQIVLPADPRWKGDVASALQSLLGISTARSPAKRFRRATDFRRRVLEVRELLS